LNRSLSGYRAVVAQDITSGYSVRAVHSAFAVTSYHRHSANCFARRGTVVIRPTRDLSAVAGGVARLEVYAPRQDHPGDAGNLVGERNRVECCLGTRPSQAANSRPFSNSLASGTLAERHVAMMRPIPGTAASRSLKSSFRWAARIALSSLATCVSVSARSPPESSALPVGPIGV